MLTFLKVFAYIMVLLGAINWGLIGIFNFNLVSLLFGDMTVLSRIIYITVGVSAVVYALTRESCDCRYENI